MISVAVLRWKQSISMCFAQTVLSILFHSVCLITAELGCCIFDDNCCTCIQSTHVEIHSHSMLIALKCAQYKEKGHQHTETIKNLTIKWANGKRFVVAIGRVVITSALIHLIIVEEKKNWFSLCSVYDATTISCVEFPTRVKYKFSFPCFVWKNVLVMWP